MHFSHKKIFSNCKLLVPSLQMCLEFWISYANVEEKHPLLIKFNALCSHLMADVTYEINLNLMTFSDIYATFLFMANVKHGIKW